MRSLAVLFASTALTGLLLSGCSDNGMFGRSSTATPSPAAQRAAATAEPSADIRDSQQQLKSLGYYDGAVDGRWGPETQSAVERYQRERGLSTSGQIDSRTRESLRQASAGRTGAGQDRLAASSSTEARNLNTPGTATPGTSSTGGSAGTTQRSESAGQGVGSPGSQREYIGQQQLGQRSKDQTNPGNRAQQSADERRLQDVSPAAGPGAGASAAISPKRLSEEGAREVQQKLADKGHQAAVDGVWGPQSQKALVNFQTQNGLRADGVIGPRTANALGIDLQLLSANHGTSGSRNSGDSTTTPSRSSNEPPGGSGMGTAPGSAPSGGSQR